MSETQTRHDLLVQICQTVGVKPDPNQDSLKKMQLNSIHAYLTGELFERPDRVYVVGSNSRENMLKNVLREAEIGLDATDLPERSKPYQLRKNELESLLQTLEDSRDKREWTP